MYYLEKVLTDVTRMPTGSKAHKNLSATGKEGGGDIFGLPTETLRCWLYLLVSAKKRIYTV